MQEEAAIEKTSDVDFPLGIRTLEEAWYFQLGYRISKGIDGRQTFQDATLNTL